MPMWIQRCERLIVVEYGKARNKWKQKLRILLPGATVSDTMNPWATSPRMEPSKLSGLSGSQSVAGFQQFANSFNTGDLSAVVNLVYRTSSFSVYSRVVFMSQLIAGSRRMDGDHNPTIHWPWSQNHDNPLGSRHSSHCWDDLYRLIQERNSSI